MLQPAPGKLCSIEKCGKPVHALGWCSMHRSRFKRNGDPLIANRRVNMDFFQRFMEQVTIGDECWVWTDLNKVSGYGVTIKAYGGGQAHRASYEEFVGPIPPGLQIDHLCRNRGCVRPDHLEVVTPLENSKRGLKGILTTHCPHGHEYTPENTVIHRRKTRGPSRECRTCTQRRDRLRYTESKGK